MRACLLDNCLIEVKVMFNQLKRSLERFILGLTVPLRREGGARFDQNDE